MPEPKIIIAAFNKKIAMELTKRLVGTRAEAKTLHAIGMGIVMTFWQGVDVYDRDKHDVSRADMLTNKVCGMAAPDAIKRLVSKLHSLGRETLPHATTGAELEDLALQFECAPDEQWDEMGFNLQYVCAKAAEAMELAATVKPLYIDFSDMIFLPVRNKWLTKKYDAGLIDEAQDMTKAQLELFQGVVRGRVIIIGDRNQAIYAFRGADSNSISRLQVELNAKALPLTTTYRCGKAIVREAQRFVPHFEAADTNGEGEVLSLPAAKLVETAGPGDFILSRLNAPLVSYAMRLLKSGKRTRIAGRDIGKGLVALMRKLKAKSVPDLLRKLAAWKEREIQLLNAKYAVDKREGNAAYQGRLDGILDQHSMLSELTEGCANVQCAIDRVESLFQDVDNLGDAGVITCSSVHRSKGLEAKRVFVLVDTLRDWDQEELNIQYVAITRAIETLVYVSGK